MAKTFHQSRKHTRVAKIFLLAKAVADTFLWGHLGFCAVRVAKAKRQRAQLIGYAMTAATSSRRRYLRWVHLMEFGAKLGCHQMAERSFFIKGYQFPICARCTGVTIGSFIAVFFYFLCKIPLWVCVLLCTIMFVDWLIQRVGILASTNIRRLITGVLGGLGCMTVQLYCYIFAVRAIASFVRGFFA